MSTRYNPSIVRDNLVLYLDAANTKSYTGSGTTWTDISGKGHHGTLDNGPTFSSGNMGYISLDGTNDHINFRIDNANVNGNLHYDTNDYFADMVIEQLDRDGSVLKRYDFRGCWPKAIAEIAVGYESEAIEEFECTWAVQYWESNTTT